MAIGDQNDLLARLRSVLPTGWFSTTTPGDDSNTPVLDGVLSGGAWVGSWLYDLVEYVAQQRRLATASSVNLDLIANDFFGGNLPRLGGQLDDAYRARITANLFAPKATRAAVIQALQTLTGQTPGIFEPRNTSDTGGYGFQGMSAGTGLAYGAAGGYGSLLLPFQAFVKAYRPQGGGIAKVAGYYDLTVAGSALGGYGVGAIEYASMDMLTGRVTDDDIYAAVNASEPIGTVLWCSIQDKQQGATSPLKAAAIARLVKLAQGQTLSAKAFLGGISGTVVKVQADQLLAAATLVGNGNASLRLVQDGQTIVGVALVSVLWNPSDKSSTITLSGSNLTAASTSSTSGGVRATTPRSSGSWYLEDTATTALSGERYGFATPTWSKSTALGSDVNSVGIDTSGNIWFDNSVIGKLATGIAATNVIRLGYNVESATLLAAVNGGPFAAGGFVSGSHSVGTSGSQPVITAPTTATALPGISLDIAGLSVADTIWPTSGNVSLNVSCLNGTLTLDPSPFSGDFSSDFGSGSFSGSGTNTLSASDTDANIQSTIGAIAYTASIGHTSDTITIKVIDQNSHSTTVTIPVTIQPTSTVPQGIKVATNVVAGQKTLLGGDLSGLSSPDFANNLSTLTSAMGQAPQMLATSIDYSHGWGAPFTSSASGAAAEFSGLGYIPCVSIGMATSVDTSADAAFTDIINGVHDADFEAAFGYFAAVSSVFYIRPGYQFNDAWPPWAVTSLNKADYVSAFQHIANLAHSFSGATIKVIWCPGGGSPFDATTYPGDSYVDLISINQFGFGESGTANSQALETDGTVWSFAYGATFAVSHGKSFSLDFACDTAADTPSFTTVVVQALTSVAGLVVDHVTLSNNPGREVWATDATAAAAWKQAFTSISAYTASNTSAPAQSLAGLAVSAAYSASVASTSVTANFGGSTFAYSVPPGYSPWLQENPTTAPSSPTNLVASAETTGSITLTWNPSS